MIAKLNNGNRRGLLKFLESEKELNLFIIGDAENYGFNEAFLEYWADFDASGQIIAVLMRFYEDFTVYGRGEFDVFGFSEIIRENKCRVLSGEKSIVEKFSNYIAVAQKRHMYFAKLDKPNKLYDGELLALVLPIKLEDTTKLWELHVIVDNGEVVQQLDRLQKKFIDKAGRGYYLTNDKKHIISSAETTAENSYSTMVVGVCTHPIYRGRGYATAVISRLCNNLLSEGKTVCLFYDNPTAGKIYKGIGFRDIGFWSIWKVEEEQIVCSGEEKTG